MIQNKINLLNAIKNINEFSITPNVDIIDAIKAIPTPEMELQMRIAKEKLRREATIKNINQVTISEKVIAAPVEETIKPEPVKAGLTIDASYLDLLKGK